MMWRKMVMIVILSIFSENFLKTVFLSFYRVIYNSKTQDSDYKNYKTSFLTNKYKSLKLKANLKLFHFQFISITDQSNATLITPPCLAYPTRSLPFIHPIRQSEQTGHNINSHNQSQRHIIPQWWPDLNAWLDRSLDDWSKTAFAESSSQWKWF